MKQLECLLGHRLPVNWYLSNVSRTTDTSLRSRQRATLPRVVLADDNLAMLKKIHELLQSEFEVVGMVSDGQALVEAALRLKPEFIVSDISMPGLNGFEAARRILDSLPRTKVVFLTMHGGNEYRREGRIVGAAGYVLKHAAREELKPVLLSLLDITS